MYLLLYKTCIICIIVSNKSIPVYFPSVSTFYHHPYPRRRRPAWAVLTCSIGDRGPDPLHAMQGGRCALCWGKLESDNWVGCARCTAWFHYMCLPVKFRTMSDECVYVCRECKLGQAIFPLFWKSDAPNVLFCEVAWYNNCVIFSDF